MPSENRSSLVGVMIALMIGALVALEVVIPVIQDGIASANVTGTTATILGMIPMFVSILLLVAVASPLMSRV